MLRQNRVPVALEQRDEAAQRFHGAAIPANGTRKIYLHAARLARRPEAAPRTRTQIVVRLLPGRARDGDEQPLRDPIAGLDGHDLARDVQDLDLDLVRGAAVDRKS